MTTSAHLLQRPEGRLAYTLTGTGPLVVTAPGMGDLKEVFRDLSAALVGAGHRVADLDLRGHGASDATFTTHGWAAIAEDLVALVEHLGGPAVLVGASASAGAVALVAAERPDLVAGVVMLDPHVQPHPTSRVGAVLAKVQVAALAGPWAAAAWTAYYTSLHRGRRAPWFDGHRAAVRASLGRPAHRRSFHALAHALVTAPPLDVLPRVTSPALVVHGAEDPEFADPAGELAWALEHLTAAPDVRGLLVPECGHYPHSQRPDLVVPAVLGLLSGLRDGDTWAAARA